jgi:Predicted transcriptional regulator with C-terminal CBS domains
MVESPIREIRRNLGITQRELASAAGMKASSQISEMEHGLRGISPSLAVLLERAHFDVAEIKQKQDAFCEALRAEVLVKLSEYFHSA